MCVQELRWAREASVPIQPVIRSEDKGNIGILLKLAPDDLKDLGNTDWLDLIRNDVDYFELGIRKLAQAMENHAALREREQAEELRRLREVQLRRMQELRSEMNRMPLRALIKRAETMVSHAVLDDTLEWDGPGPKQALVELMVNDSEMQLTFEALACQPEAELQFGQPEPGIDDVRVVPAHDPSTPTFPPCLRSALAHTRMRSLPQQRH